MPTNARKQHRIGTGGPWGSGLLLLGIALTVQGISYHTTTDPTELRPALAWINQAIPVTWWALLWIGSGIYCIWKALTPPQRHIDLAPAVGVICLWAAIFAIHWLINGLVEGDWTREWTGAVAWAGLACVLISFGRCVNPPQRRSGG